MPVLQGALICDSAHDYNGLVSVLGGFVGVIQVQRIPVPASIWFAGRVGFTSEEATEAHELVVRVVADGSDAPLAEVRGSVGPQDTSKFLVPEQMGGVNLVFPLPFQIEHLGAFWVELKVDGDLFSRLPLQVIQAR